MQTTGDMHYMQAALIGAFFEPATIFDSRRVAARDRRVWVAHRGVDSAFATRAAKVGLDKRNPDLYVGTTRNLDDLWQRAERDLSRVQAVVDEITYTGEVPARALANVLAPYCAHLLARHPRLGLEGRESVLGRAGEARDQALAAREALFYRLCDALLTRRRWLVVPAPAATALVTTDLGWQWVPGAGLGELFIPVNPGAALVIRDDGRTYEPGREYLDVPVPAWADWEVALRRDAMILTAPSEVYSATRPQAEAALALWATPAPDDGPVEDGSRATAHSLAGLASSAVVELFADGAAHDPGLAFARLIAIQHRWGCECDAAIADIVDPRERDRARRGMRAALRQADASLRQQGLA